jgi:hypothetical protein
MYILSSEFNHISKTSGKVVSHFLPISESWAIVYMPYKRPIHIRQIFTLRLANTSPFYE